MTDPFASIAEAAWAAHRHADRLSFLLIGVNQFKHDSGVVPEAKQRELTRLLLASPIAETTRALLASLTALSAALQPEQILSGADEAWLHKQLAGLLDGEDTKPARRLSRQRRRP